MQPTVKCTHSLGMHTLHLHAGFLMKHTLVHMYMVWHFLVLKAPFCGHACRDSFTYEKSHAHICTLHLPIHTLHCQIDLVLWNAG